MLGERLVSASDRELHLSLGYMRRVAFSRDPRNDSGRHYMRRCIYPLFSDPLHLSSVRICGIRSERIIVFGNAYANPVRIEQAPLGHLCTDFSLFIRK
jgi:hypothetical protein